MHDPTLACWHHRDAFSDVPSELEPALTPFLRFAQHRSALSGDSGLTFFSVPSVPFVRAVVVPRSRSGRTSSVASRRSGRSGSSRSASRRLQQTTYPCPPPALFVNLCTRAQPPRPLQRSCDARRPCDRSPPGARLSCRRFSPRRAHGRSPFPQSYGPAPRASRSRTPRGVPGSSCGGAPGESTRGSFRTHSRM